MQAIGKTTIFDIATRKVTRDSVSVLSPKLRELLWLFGASVLLLPPISLSLANMIGTSELGRWWGIDGQLIVFMIGMVIVLIGCTGTEGVMTSRISRLIAEGHACLNRLDLAMHKISFGAPARILIRVVSVTARKILVVQSVVRSVAVLYYVRVLFTVLIMAFCVVDAIIARTFGSSVPVADFHHANFVAMCLSLLLIHIIQLQGLRPPKKSLVILEREGLSPRGLLCRLHEQIDHSLDNPLCLLNLHVALWKLTIEKTENQRAALCQVFKAATDVVSNLRSCGLKNRDRADVYTDKDED